MPLPELGTKEFNQYLEDITSQNQPKRHKFYTEAVGAMENMGVHMTGDDPKKLLDIKRPNEDKEAKKYRLESYKPKTKSSANKATSIINRIYNERLFSITFPENPSQLVSDEDILQTYLTEEMPLYVSLINFLKTVFTKMHLKDANGLVGVLPIDFDVDDGKILEPIPIFYTSEELVDFEDGKYYTILREKKKKNNAIGVTKQKVIIYTTEKIIVLAREKEGDEWVLKIDHDHNFDFPPAFRVGGIVIDTHPPQLFESYIAGVLPHWDDAVAMLSDKAAAMVNHVYPEKWEFTIDCDNDGCQNGKVIVKGASTEDTTIDCPRCKGSGKKTTKGPFDIYQVNKDALNPDSPLITPPGGYMEKELESTKLLIIEAEKEIRKGFEAINMDIVNEVGENQSGIAKVIDRQDLDGFLDVYSGHVFKFVIPNIILFITMWRYWTIYKQNIKLIKETLPLIKEPTTFDVFSISLLTDELEKLTKAGAGGPFLTGIRKDIIDKRFTDEKTKNFFNTIIDVDPISHLTGEDIMVQSRVIGQTEMFIHTYAKDLVEEAMSTKEGFLSLDLQVKKQIIRDLAISKEPEVILPEPEPDV